MNIIGKSLHGKQGSNDVLSVSHAMTILEQTRALHSDKITSNKIVLAVGHGHEVVTRYISAQNPRPFNRPRSKGRGI